MRQQAHSLLSLISRARERGSLSPFRWWRSTPAAWRAGLPCGARGSRPGDGVRTLVDDDPQALLYAGDVLTKAGYAPVVVTGDPEEALRLVATEKPQLVLLDLVLPGADGIELMQSILAIADVPVIFLLVYAQDDVIAQAFDAGAEDYVVKPLSPTELSARIRAALRRREMPEPSGALRAGGFGGGLRPAAGDPGRQPGATGRHRVPDAVRAGVQRGAGADLRAPLLRVWGPENNGDVRPMRTVVNTLRRKLGDNADLPTYIFTEPRVGYRMAEG